MSQCSYTVSTAGFMSLFPFIKFNFEEAVMTNGVCPSPIGKSLKTLMSKGILQVHPPICDCPGCRISSPVVRAEFCLLFEKFHQLDMMWKHV